MSEKARDRKDPSMKLGQGSSRKTGTGSSNMSDKVSRRKQPKTGSTQVLSHAKGASSSVMSVYKSSADDSVRNKDTKQSSLYKSSQEYFEFSCEPCKTAGNHVEAQGLCPNCDQYLCGNCFQNHSSCKGSMFLNQATSSNVDKAGAGELNCNEEYTHIRDIDVKADTDENDCYIAAIALVSKTELVLCDYQNNSLKLVDIDINIIKDVLSIPETPTKVTAISEDQVAVVFGEKFRIQIVSIPGQLVVVRTIKTSGVCMDVKHSNGKLYVSFEDPVKFQILQLTGGISKTIKPDANVLEHCTCPRYIAVSPDERLIYMSDWRANKVMSMDMDGNMISMYQDELDEPSDITISPFGSVYLCSRGHDVVYKMTSDLREATVELGPEDGIERPHVLCFNAGKQHLYISCGIIDYQNVIKVYKWK